MSANLPSHWKPTKVRTIELLVSEPSTKIGDIAVEVGVSKSTIHLWLKDPEFVEVFYQKYMVSFGSKLPNVLNSMIREAEAGNVQAGRLVLEHSGKLIKRVEVANHQSPFEKFLSADETDSKEIKSMMAEYEDVSDETIQVLPQRPQVKNIDKKPTKKQELKSLRSKEIRNKKRRDARIWRERAIKAGIPMKSGRQTPAQRKKWQQEVISKEVELS